MKTIKFLTIIAAFCSLMGLSSCNKPSDDDTQKQALAITIEVSNIRAVLAVVDITLDKPADIVRFIAMPKAELDAAANTADAEAVKTYISQNGETIECPFNKVLTGLTNGTEYVVGVVAYDAEMNASYKTVTFNTLAEDDRVVGDESSAGSLTENTL